MIRVTQIKLNIRHTDKELEEKLIKKLGIRPYELGEYFIVKRSLDARDKTDILYSYTIQVHLAEETERRVLDKARRGRSNDICRDDSVSYRLPENGKAKLKHRPVIIGFGPAGMFAGLAMARAGLRPIILERGQCAEERKKTVESFWAGGELDIASNVSFGEGGAGTFSDGKLNTLVKDSCGRNTEVLRTLAEFGADSDILYVHNPHIGTDKLIGIVTNIRKEIIRLGGEVRFNTQVMDFNIEGGRLRSVVTADTSVYHDGDVWLAVSIEENGPGTGETAGHSGNTDNRPVEMTSAGRTAAETLETDAAVLAIGHSARDTFYRLDERDVSMQAKAFAVGLRIQHPQSMIDISQFGSEASFLGPASYKLTETVSSGRGVYSFCMCPGGYVVDASSEKGMKCVNGMSCHGRDSGNANSAIIVGVNPEDFGGNGALAGIEFQRRLEKAAFDFGSGKIPVQLLGDYMSRRESYGFGDVAPVFKGGIHFARLDQCLPEYIHESLTEAMPEFERRIKGFSRPDAILAGVESRTSSPVRILRDTGLVSNIDGLYPCGEGAGYAGGITSAAMDGLRIAEKIIEKYSAL